MSMTSFTHPPQPKANTLACAQILAAYSANLSAETELGDVISVTITQGLDVGDGNPCDWFRSVQGWPPFRIAVACRLADDARRALRLGLVDPADSSLAELTSTASAACDWDGAPAPCPKTFALVREATAAWSPSRHQLYHDCHRAVVRLLLLVGIRLRKLNGGAGCPLLPTELWFVVCKALRRSDFLVEESVHYTY